MALVATPTCCCIRTAKHLSTLWGSPSYCGIRAARRRNSSPATAMRLLAWLFRHQDATLRLGRAHTWALQQVSMQRTRWALQWHAVTCGPTSIHMLGRKNPASAPKRPTLSLTVAMRAHRYHRLGPGDTHAAAPPAAAKGAEGGGPHTCRSRAGSDPAA